MLAKYASLHNHISSNKNAANGEFIFPKRIFVFLQSSKRCKRTRPRDSHPLQREEENVHVENPYFYND